MHILCHKGLLNVSLWTWKTRAWDSHSSIALSCVHSRQVLMTFQWSLKQGHFACMECTCRLQDAYTSLSEFALLWFWAFGRFPRSSQISVSTLYFSMVHRVILVLRNGFHAVAVSSTLNSQPQCLSIFSPKPCIINLKAKSHALPELLLYHYLPLNSAHRHSTTYPKTSFCRVERNKCWILISERITQKPILVQ